MKQMTLADWMPEDYIIDRDYRWRKYPTSEQVKRIGNSVVPIMAKEIVAANCPYLKVGERVPISRIYWGAEGQMAFA